MARRLFPVAVTALALLAPGLAAADAGKLVHTTQYRDHPVKGATPSAVWSYLVTHPIIDPDDGPALANLTHDHTLKFSTEREGGSCRVSGLTFTWKFVITLPKAVDASRMSASTRGMWNGFVAYLRRHEEEHRTIFLACGKEFVPAAAKLTGSCFGLKRKVRRYVDKQYAGCMRRQDEFHKREGDRLSHVPFVRAARGK